MIFRRPSVYGLTAHCSILTLCYIHTATYAICSPHVCQASYVDWILIVQIYSLYTHIRRNSILPFPWTNPHIRIQYHCPITAVSRFSELPIVQIQALSEQIYFFNQDAYIAILLPSSTRTASQRWSDNLHSRASHRMYDLLPPFLLPFPLNPLFPPPFSPPPILPLSLTYPILNPQHHRKPQQTQISFSPVKVSAQASRANKPATHATPRGDATRAWRIAASMDLRARRIRIARRGVVRVRCSAVISVMGVFLEQGKDRA